MTDLVHAFTHQAQDGHPIEVWWPADPDLRRKVVTEAVRALGPEPARPEQAAAREQALSDDAPPTEPPQETGDPELGSNG